MTDDSHAPEGPCRQCGYEDELNNAGYCYSCDQSTVRYYALAITSLMDRQKKEDDKRKETR